MSVSVDKDSVGDLEFLLAEDMVAGALALVGTRRLVCIASRSTGRHFYSIRASSGRTEPYRCFDGFCTCPDYTFSVLQRGRKLFVRVTCPSLRALRPVWRAPDGVVRVTSGPSQCKHVLAVRLAEAIREITVKTLDDVAFVDALSAAP